MRPQPPRRGFSVIELLVALALAAVVSAAALSLLALVGRSEQAVSRTMRSSVRFAGTQFVVRRAMQSLIAAPPLDPPAEDEATDDDAADENGDETEDDAENGSATDEALAGIDEEILSQIVPGVDGDLPMFVAEADESVPPYFELYWEDLGGGIVLPRLEVVLSRSPVGERPLDMATLADESARQRVVATRYSGWVRGAFEILELPDGWALQWRPMDPPGDPTLLARGLVRCGWEVLPPDDEVGGWTSVWAAYLESDYPDAVRLVMESSDGEVADWVFETIVVTEDD